MKKDEDELDQYRTKAEMGRRGTAHEYPEMEDPGTAGSNLAMLRMHDDNIRQPRAAVAERGGTDYRPYLGALGQGMSKAQFFLPPGSQAPMVPLPNPSANTMPIMQARPQWAPQGPGQGELMNYQNLEKAYKPQKRDGVYSRMAR